MSHNPYASPTPLGDPANYTTPGKVVAPVAGMVLGILHLMYAGLTFVCNGISGLVFFVPLPPEMSKGNAAVELMDTSLVYKIFNQTSLIISLISAVVLFIAGIGLLQVKPYGRKLSIYYCIYDFISITLGLLVNGILLFPLLINQINTFPSGSPESMGAYGGLIGGLVGVALSLVYPLIVIIFMYRPKMIEAYRGS